MNLLEIFKAGTWTTMDGQELSFSSADLAATAAAYDPAVFKAPLVVGHPKINDPAYGWVSKLAVNDDTLTAERDQVEPAFAEMVNAGRFPKVSASFFAPHSPSNPKPGVWYLRHVGFLGAAAPAVAGLKPASFADVADGIVIIEFAGDEPATTLIPKEPIVTDKTKTSDDKTVEFAAQQAELQRQSADIAAREKALQEKEAAARKSEIASFADQLVKEGKVLPREQAGLVAFMAGLDDADTVSFAADNGEVKKPTGEWLREFLNGLPPRVDFAEHTAAGADADAGNSAASFAAPAGYSVNRDRLALHGRIVAHQKKHNVDYATAAAAVGG